MIINPNDRVAKVGMTYEFLSVVMSGKIKTAETGRVLETNAPRDLQVIGIKDDPEGRETAYVYFKSASVAPVPEGAEPPLVPPFHYAWVEEMVSGRLKES